jgi:hypothetical protein
MSNIGFSISPIGVTAYCALRRILRSVRHFISARPPIILVAIMIAAAAVSTYRVYSVPILQCPDENSHIDYAFSLYSAGRLLNVRTPPSSGWNTKYVAESYDWERISHLYTLYLSKALNERAVRLAESNKEPAEYGSDDFFKMLDQNAPRLPIRIPNLSPRDNPWLMSDYPAGYYGLTAFELKGVSLFTNSLTRMFFSARLMSVALLMIDIIFTYLILLKVRARYPLAITSIFALFPLTTYVSSCVQPDNLVLTLVLSTWLLGLSVNGARSDRVRLPLLSIVMGLLLFTKFQFFPFAVGPIVGRLAFKRAISLVTTAAMFLPSAVAIATQVWIMKGGDLPGHAFFADHRNVGIYQQLFDAVREYYFGGYAYVSYWSTSYGWAGMPLPLKICLQVGTAMALGLSIVYLAQSAARLLELAKRKPRLAAIVALNPLVTGHVWFIAFMIALFAATGNGFYAQGRHFFPFILSGLYIAIEVAPRTFRRSKEFASRVAIVFLLLFCVFGGMLAASAVVERYYVKQAMK